MAYVALYRKYRPLCFSDIVGQEAVTKILKKQINAGKISHAYIFSGCRGTGKTSAAKIFSRAVNCLNPVDGEPCNECEICKKILNGTTTDVVEMDAASNNSVENIRQIRQEVVYSTVDTKYRVYIIDEAHMLTTSAFNALLKTLEEPPENVIFILATTEQHKIPITILSRCLKFEFNRLSQENIMQRLKYVLSQENIEYEENALLYIAKLADGALRDALSILDRCQSESKDKLDYESVLKIVGGINNEIVQDIVSNIIKMDSVSAIDSVEKVISSGKDIRQLNTQIIQEFLNILINKNNEKANYDNIDDNKIILIIDRLSKLDNDLKYAISQATVMKACIVEISLASFGAVASSNGNASSDVIKNLENKIVKLEEKINKLQQSPASRVLSSSSMAVKQNVPKIDMDIDIYKICNEFTMLDDLKKELAKAGKLKIFSALSNAKVYEKENILLFIINNKFAYDILIQEDSIEQIAYCSNELCGKSYFIKIELKEQGEDEISIIEKVLAESGITYTNID